MIRLDYSYNADGTVASVTDKSDVAALAGKSATTAYTYDSLARTTQIQQSGDGSTPKRVNYTFNDDSSVDTITRYGGANYTLVATTKHRTTAGIATQGSGYDGMGRLIAMQQTFGSTTHAYTWQFDAASNITASTSPDGSNGYTLDSTNQIQSASP